MWLFKKFGKFFFVSDDDDDDVSDDDDDEFVWFSSKSISVSISFSFGVSFGEGGFGLCWLILIFSFLVELVGM